MPAGHSVTDMIAVSALILLAEVSATCAPLGSARLGGDAMFVLPVGTFEPVPFERLGPTTSVVTRPEEVQQASGTAPDQDPESDQPAEQCAVADILIV